MWCRYNAVYIYPKSLWKMPHSLPLRAGYGVCVVISKYALCFAPVIVLLYVISWYIALRRYGTRVYIGTMENLHKCTYCPCTVMTGRQPYDHQRKEHGAQNVVGPYCPKYLDFKTPSALKRHLKLKHTPHEGELFRETSFRYYFAVRSRAYKSIPRTFQAPAQPLWAGLVPCCANGLQHAAARAALPSFDRQRKTGLVCRTTAWSWRPTRWSQWGDYPNGKTPPIAPEVRDILLPPSPSPNPHCPPPTAYLFQNGLCKSDHFENKKVEITCCS